MHLRPFFLFFFFLLTFVKLFSQEKDTSYITPLSNSKVFGLHTTLQKFELQFQSNKKELNSFETHNVGIGFRFKFKKIGASVSFPIVALGSGDKDKSRLLGIRFGLFPASFYVNGQFRVVSGLDNLKSLTSQPIQTFQKEIQGYYASLYGAYLFNRDQFSLRSAFRMVDRQQRSSGSWLISSTLELHNYQLDSLQLPLNDISDNSISQYKRFNIALGGGYAYTWVIGHWSATALVSAGIEGSQQIYLNDENSKSRQYQLKPRINGFASIIHNDDHFFYGVQGSYLPELGKSATLDVLAKYWMVRTTVGWRF